ncbi:hypothetical protein CLAIMM_04166 [Cladophialophora immunda]|nr:hypothetical protein CLAIMM_04166 [Cladophialophora immunda]
MLYASVRLNLPKNSITSGVASNDFVNAQSHPAHAARSVRLTRGTPNILLNFAAVQEAVLALQIDTSVPLRPALQPLINVRW